MKKIKLSLLAVALMVATAASAQVSFGIQGGANLSNMMHNIEELSTNPKFGFNAGVLTDIGLTHNIGIRSGLFFHTKGFRTSDIMDGTDIRNRTTTDLMYLQLPVHFAYKIDVTPGTRVVLHAGPYVAYGIGGSLRINDERVDDFTAFGNEGEFKPFDFGFGIGVGFEFGRFLTGIGWDMGLLNIANDNANDNGNGNGNGGVSFRNQNAHLTVGFRF